MYISIHPCKHKVVISTCWCCPYPWGSPGRIDLELKKWRKSTGRRCAQPQYMVSIDVPNSHWLVDK